MSEVQIITAETYATGTIYMELGSGSRRVYVSAMRSGFVWVHSARHNGLKTLGLGKTHNDFSKALEAYKLPEVRRALIVAQNHVAGLRKAA